MRAFLASTLTILFLESYFGMPSLPIYQTLSISSARGLKHTDFDQQCNLPLHLILCTRGAEYPTALRLLWLTMFLAA